MIAMPHWSPLGVRSNQLRTLITPDCSTAFCVERNFRLAGHFQYLKKNEQNKGQSSSPSLSVQGPRKPQVVMGNHGVSISTHHMETLWFVLRRWELIVTQTICVLVNYKHNRAEWTHNTQHMGIFSLLGALTNKTPPHTHMRAHRPESHGTVLLNHSIDTHPSQLHQRELVLAHSMGHVTAFSPQTNYLCDCTFPSFSSALLISSVNMSWLCSLQLPVIKVYKFSPININGIVWVKYMLHFIDSICGMLPVTTKSITSV